MSRLRLVQTCGEGYLSYLFPLSPFHLFQLQAVVLNVNGGHLYQFNIAGDAAVVPPVEDLRGHILCVTLVVNLHDDRVLALLQQLCDIEVERCEATNVMPGLLTVHPHPTVVVHRPEIEQTPDSCLLTPPLKTLLEPHRAFVEEQPFVLRIPVARDLHRGRLVEVILDEVFGFLWLRIHEESPACGVHAIVVVALLLNIYDIVPLAIERHTLIGVHILDHWQCLCSGHRRENHSHDSDKEFPNLSHHYPSF